MLPPIDSLLMRRAAVVALLLVACCGCRPSGVVISGTAEQRTQPKTALADLERDVFVLTSGAACETGVQTEILPRTKADEQLIRTVFKDAVALDAEALASAGEAVGEGASSKNRMVIFFYSGHGVRKLSDHGIEESHLCLPSGEIGVSELVRWISARGPAGAIIVLNACESAHVDPSIVSAFPLSVISASIDETTAILPGSPSNGTAVAQGLFDVLGGAPDHADENCDGLVTDVEFFHAFENELRARSAQSLARAPDVPLAIPVPKLRSNAGYPLPFMATSSRSSKRCEQLLSAKTRAAQELPVFSRWLDGDVNGRQNYFVLTQPGGVLAFRECKDLEEPFSKVCNLFGAELAPVPDVTSRTSLAHVAALAKTATDSEVFEVRVDPPWLELVELRNGLTLTVTTLDHAADAVPVRDRVLRRVTDDSILKQYGGAVCREKLEAFAPKPVPCMDSIGQCFWLNAEPAVGKDHCDASR